MTTLEDRPGTALLVIDVQNGVVAGNHDRDNIVANINTAVGKAREAGVPVVWIQDFDPGKREPGMAAWDIVPELDPREDEPHVRKEWGDSFEDTDLESVLAGLKVGAVVVAGAQTDACIRSTLHGAITRGYDTLLVSDAHTTEDLSSYGAPSPDMVIAHTNLYWEDHSAPGRQGGIVTTKDLSFG